MDLLELKDKLYWNNVPEYWYSLDDGLKPDACNLFRNYEKWEYFYLDERGGRNDYKIFNRAEDAYEHLWKKMERQLEVFNIRPKQR